MFEIKRCLCILLILLQIFLLPVASAEPEESKTAQFSALFTTAELMDATVAQLLDAMAQGHLTSERLVQMYIDRIEAYDKALGLNSIIDLNPKALEEAKAADVKRAKGMPLGRLHGIPVIVKDNLDLTGMATTCGDVHRSYAIAKQDAEVIARLKAEGAIILAKANMAKYAASGSDSRSSKGGTVHNAYDLSRTPAGSSGGTAVAITCNFAAVGLGTDTGASIRRPASYANIIGLRPSFGLVSLYGEFYLDWYQDVIGPMCRSAEDTALVLDIIAGSDRKDYRSAKADEYLPEDGYLVCLKPDGLVGKRIGYLANSFDYSHSRYSGSELKEPVLLDEKIRPMVDRALARLQEGGAELVDISSLLTEQRICYLSRNDTRETMAQFRREVTQLLEENDIDAVIYISQTDVADLEKEARKCRNFHPAYYIGAFGPKAGLPEIMLPMGLSETDVQAGYHKPMPLGMSLFAGYGKERVLLEIAYAYEQLCEKRQQPPYTPPLRDDGLINFAEQLLADAQKLEAADYTEESFADLTLASLAAENSLKTLNMASLHAKTQKLAEAYDALEPAPVAEPAPPTQPPTAPPAPPVVTEPLAAEKQGVNSWLWPAISAGLALAILLELYQRRAACKRTPAKK